MFMRTPTNLPAKETAASSSSETLADPAATSCFGDRRDHARLVCGGPVWWKNSSWDTFAQGWLLERSPDGIAYLTRGSLTVVEGEFEGDAYFPEYESGEWVEVESTHHDADEHNPHRHRFVILERK